MNIVSAIPCIVREWHLFIPKGRCLSQILDHAFLVCYHYKKRDIEIITVLRKNEYMLKVLHALRNAELLFEDCESQITVQRITSLASYACKRRV